MTIRFTTLFSNLTEFKSTIVSKWSDFTSFCQTQFANIGTWFSDLKNSFVEWLGTAVNNIISFKDIVVAWFGNFFGGLSELFLGLFIPSDAYFEEKNKALRALLEGKIKYTEVINSFTTFKNLTAAVPENITCTLYGQTFTIIDWSYLIEVRPTIYFWVRGFFYPFFLIYQYNQVYKLIRGSSYVGNGKSGGEINGQMSFDWGDKK